MVERLNLEEIAGKDTTMRGACGLTSINTWSLPSDRKLFLDSVGGWCMPVLSWWNEVVWLIPFTSETPYMYMYMYMYMYIYIYMYMYMYM